MLENILRHIFKVKVVVKIQGQMIKTTKAVFLRSKASIALFILRPEASNLQEKILRHIVKVMVSPSHTLYSVRARSLNLITGRYVNRSLTHYVTHEDT